MAMKISIASGKGGTGKTTLAVNLAAYLALEHDVILADLDVEEPNSGLFIHGNKTYEQAVYRMIPEWDSEKCSLCSLCTEVCAFHAISRVHDDILVFPQLCHSCYACSELCPVNALPMVQKKIGTLKQFESGKLTLIESILDIGEEQAVPLIKHAIQFTDESFPEETIRIFDAPPGTSCPMVEAVKHADKVILITEPTPVGLYDLQLAVETLQALQKAFVVVLNRYDIGNSHISEFCRDKQIPLIATIPNQRKIAECYSRGELLYNTIPEVKLALDQILEYFHIPLQALQVSKE
jgi:MinD superfamily P-loop ATPase